MSRSHLISKTYTVTLEQNSNIPSPYHYFAEVNLTSDIAKYGEVVSVIVGGKSTQPIAVKFGGTFASLFIYAINLPSDGTTVNVKVLYK